MISRLDKINDIVLQSKDFMVEFNPMGIMGTLKILIKQVYERGVGSSAGRRDSCSKGIFWGPRVT